MGDSNMSIKTKLITLKFEGYEFDVVIEYYDIDLISLKHFYISMTNTINQDVNRQSYYHHLNLFKKELLKGDRDNEIIKIIKREMND